MGAPISGAPAEAPIAVGVTEASPDLIGYIDKVGAGKIQGWAASRSAPARRVTVRLYLDDELVGEGVAQDSRDDVRDAGYGDGLHGFELPVPKKALFCAEMVNLAVIDAAGEETVVHRHRLRQPIASGTPILYMDASDLIEFLTHHRELSGIQRVQAGYLLGLGNTTIAGVQCRICTRLKSSNFYFDVPYAAFVALLKAAGDLAIVQKVSWTDHVRDLKASFTKRTELKPGDTIFTMGAPWALDDHNETVRCAKVYYGAHYLQVFYDLIPISVPEVVAAPLIPHFARAMAAMSIYADQIYAISRYSQDDLTASLRRLARPVPPIDVVPMGGTITDAEGGAEASTETVRRALGIEGPFVLCVGTLEPRKNHMLLFQLWRRLVANHGAEAVPKLVLVGRVGWYMEDFMRQLKITGFVEKTVVHLHGISNAELSVLYDSCLFTVFPSFSEGWGLPITESLARGRICVCSNITSMPEAGGEHALYIDPYDTSGAYDVCEKLIFDPAYKAEQERRARGFVAPSWADASEGLRAQLIALVPRLAALPKQTVRKPVELGRTYKFYNIEAASSDATSTEVFRNFLDQEDALDLLAGWNWFEVDVNCTWACGSKTELSLMLPEGGFYEGYFNLVVPPAWDDCACETLVNERVVGTSRLHAGALTYVMPLVGSARSTSVAWRLQGKQQVTSNARLLGIGVASVVIYDRASVENLTRVIQGNVIDAVLSAEKTKLS